METDLSSLFRKIVLRDGELILPFMGAIRLEDVSASFSENGMVVCPPGKKLAFDNYNLSSNDILLNEYAQQREISRMAAKRALYKELEDLRTKIEKEGRYTLDGFGTFLFDRDNGYSVDPAPGFELSTETFGLQMLDLRDRKEEPIEVVAEPEMAEEQEQPVEKVEEQVVEPEPETEPETVETPEPAETVEEVVAEPLAEVPAKKKSRSSRVLLILLTVLAILVILVLLVFIFKEELRPILEKILYSKEELEIINYKL